MEGRSFSEAVHNTLFAPLGMDRTSFLNPLPNSFEPIAKAHNRAGNAYVKEPGYEFMPEAAASGLWTTPSDLSIVLIDLYNAYAESDDTILDSETVQRMVIPVEPSEYGLGPRINYAEDNLIISHGGANNSYRAHFRLNMSTGNGYVIFTNSTSGGDLINVFRSLLEDFLHQS